MCVAVWRPRRRPSRPLGSPTLRLPDPAAVGACLCPGAHEWEGEREPARVWRLWVLPWPHVDSCSQPQGRARDRCPQPAELGRRRQAGPRQIRAGGAGSRCPLLPPGPSSPGRVPHVCPPPRQGPPGRDFTPGEPAAWLLLTVRRRPPHFCPQNLPSPAQTAPRRAQPPAGSSDLCPPSSPLSPSTEEVPEGEKLSSPRGLLSRGPDPSPPAPGPGLHFLCPSPFLGCRGPGLHAASLLELSASGHFPRVCLCSNVPSEAFVGLRI